MLLAINFNQSSPEKTIKRAYSRGKHYSTEAMPSISFNISGIQNLLSNLDPNKAYWPDGISPYILKSCSTEIAPIKIIRNYLQAITEYRKITI